MKASVGQIAAPTRQRALLLSSELLVILTLLGLAALAWLFTASEMAGMDDGPGTDPGAFGFYIATWIVMMAAMMLPSLAPMAAGLRRLERERLASLLTTPLFVLGYLAVWTVSGVGAYAVLEIGRVSTGEVFAWHRAGQALAGAMVFVAAAYEFTPLKSHCLCKWRSIAGFLADSWRDGPGGAFLMGVRSGECCLGCCWALMAALFALGAMSLEWMAVLAAMIAAEKLLPWRRTAIAAVTVTLSTVAVGVMTAPARVPGLTGGGGMSSASTMTMMR